MLGKITIQFRPLQQLTQTEPFGLCERSKLSLRDIQQILRKLGVTLAGTNAGNAAGS